MAKILVVGDVMIDKHVRGEVKRISPEAPVPVIDVIGNPTISIGAAGYVAAQIARAGHNVALTYKAAGDEIQDLLHSYNVVSYPLFGAGRKTTTKTRIWTGDQQICRIDDEDKTKPDPDVATKWHEMINERIIKDDISCVVFSDYDKGTLTDEIIQRVADTCIRYGVITILDPKRYSYFGLQNLHIVKPNKHEIGITNMSPRQVSHELGNTYLLNTLGNEGMALYRNGKEIDRIAVAGNKVRDVCGAGDVTTAMLAISTVEGNDVETAMRHASIAASMAILHEGCFIIDNGIIEMILKDDGR